MVERILDVSDLEPPEPLELTLEAAEMLRTGDYLRMRHRRFPCLLFENLKRRGFSHAIRRGNEVACEVFIWRNGDQAAASEAASQADALPEWRE